MTRLEKVKSELASKIVPDQHKIVEEYLNNINYPTNVKVNLCKSILDGSMPISNIVKLNKEYPMTDAEILKIEEDIQKRGKQAIGEILDSIPGNNKKLREMLMKYRPLLNELKEEIEIEKIQYKNSFKKNFQKN